jgi:hypothetical protein
MKKNNDDNNIIIGTFIIDFQTIDFLPDSKFAIDMMSKYQQECQLENQFALDDPVPSAGWSFAKLFLAGQFVEKLYALHRREVDSSKGKRFEDKFIAWLAIQLKNRGCGAQIKKAPEMKSF